jgi:hypothetical protein
MTSSTVNPGHWAIGATHPDDRQTRSVLAARAIEYSRRYGGTSCGWFARLREDFPSRHEFGVARDKTA